MRSPFSDEGPMPTMKEIREQIRSLEARNRTLEQILRAKREAARQERVRAEAAIREAILRNEE